MLARPWVTSELALGTLAHRDEILGLLRNLPQAPVATAGEVMELIAREQLYGAGIGYVDAHLLASTRLSGGARLWTRDRRLHAMAARLTIAYIPPER